MGIVKIFYKDECPLCPGAKKLHKDLKGKKVNVKSYNVGTAEGLAEATFYQIMALPAVMIEDDMENSLEEWRGTVPKIEEVLNVVCGS
ncbi:MAG: thioredoxin family protein [Methanomicrobium sp.]|nr:thioredoxin family protein [Methanomicrobium sp.]